MKRKTSDQSIFVGIFWIDTKNSRAPKIYSIKTPLEKAETYGCFKIHTGSHYEQWREVQAMNPAWVGEEYEDVPRGRVAFNNISRKSIVLMGRKFRRRKDVQDLIIADFCLSKDGIVWDFDDEHYQETEWVKRKVEANRLKI
ncbi:MAG TPA: hypothetical protein P5270_05395 [Victivallales bacterium]|nr:hypothetical protein [Victivallales bacterium]HPO90150.1 hypothetical protein [Victivallales bacterium]HRR28779.1 hypothetical protein [Victivallales bacterium]